MPPRSATERLQTVGQVVAVVLLLVYLGVLLHKGARDLTVLADAHPQDFWRALGRHLLRILGGG
jgi:hypothetical protein